MTSPQPWTLVSNALDGCYQIKRLYFRRQLLPDLRYREKVRLHGVRASYSSKEREHPRLDTIVSDLHRKCSNDAKRSSFRVAGYKRWQFTFDCSTKGRVFASVSAFASMWRISSKSSPNQVIMYQLIIAFLSLVSNYSIIENATVTGCTSDHFVWYSECRLRCQLV